MSITKIIGLVCQGPNSEQIYTCKFDFKARNKKGTTTTTKLYKMNNKYYYTNTQVIVAICHRSVI